MDLCHSLLGAKSGSRAKSGAWEDQKVAVQPNKHFLPAHPYQCHSGRRSEGSRKRAEECSAETQKQMHTGVHALACTRAHTSAWVAEGSTCSAIRRASAPPLTTSTSVTATHASQARKAGALSQGNSKRIAVDAPGMHGARHSCDNGPQTLLYAIAWESVSTAC